MCFPAKPPKSSHRRHRTTEEKPLVPTSVYAVTKQDQEQFCLVVGRAYGIPTVALRYFNVYGTRQALSNPYTGVCAIFSSRLLNDQKPMVFEDGEQTRDFVHVSDIVQANLLALETDRADYQAVNVGTGQATSVNALWASLAELVQPAVSPSRQPARTGDLLRSVLDVTRARTGLGWEPEVDIKEGLTRTWEWFVGRAERGRVAA